MATLIFLWYLVTTPTDKLLCSLWVSQPPTTEALTAACGFHALGKFRLDVVTLNPHAVICSRPADSLLWIAEDCALPEPLDHYRLEIIQPDFSELVCSMAVTHEGAPTDEEIRLQCKDDILARIKSGIVALRFVGSRQQSIEPLQVCTAPELTIGPGLYQQSASLADLRTQDDLTWLAGRLIWYGAIKPECEGGTSGLDPYTLAANPCGMDAARPMVIGWQNQFDSDIYNAALATHVPAHLLKRMLAIESQFWPLWIGGDGETGMMQVTENGADVFLRYDPQIDPIYPRRKIEEQYWQRLTLLNNLTCWFCSIDAAVQHTHAIIPIYARLLAAYRCRAVAINPILANEFAWRQAIADYNGSWDYVGKIENE